MKAKWSVNVIGEVTPWYRLAAGYPHDFTGTVTARIKE